MNADSFTARRFDIALSFPGEHRDVVKQVADHLAATFSEARVLYDQYHDAEFARLDLDVYLPRLYRMESELIVLFLCPQYSGKLWCKLEWRHIRQMIATVDAKRIMFLSFGNPSDLSELGILSGDGYIDILPLTPQTVAEKIHERLRLNEGVSPSAARPVRAPITNFRADISRIIKYAPAELIGREAETKLLNDAWAKVCRTESPRPHVLTFVALGGEGKTSLVAKWAAELAHQDWLGCDAAFAWSFYSQGTREQLATSSDLFLKEALTFFGDDADKEFAASPAGAFEKGQRLARIVGQRRSLLILDGLEPLQYAPTSPTPGQLKDQGIAALLKGLATTNQGLCIVSSRIELPDLRAFRGGAVIEQHLKRLSSKAGVDLLKRLGVKGSELFNLPLKDGDEKNEKVNEFEKLVEDVKGHALTLTLLGGFLKRAFHGDIRQRDRVKFEKADEKMDGGHAFRTMAAYEQWLLRDGGDEGRREVAVLRLMGLFDRPADAGCLAALRSETIPGLTEPLAGLADDDWEYCLSGLETAKLLTVNRDVTGVLVSLDAHPLIREYFASQMKTKTPAAWRTSNERLAKLFANSNDDAAKDIAELHRLYRAVGYACAALQYSEALSIYRDRIQHGDRRFTMEVAGMIHTDLEGLSHFFNGDWKRPNEVFSEVDQAYLLHASGLQLWHTGHLALTVEVCGIAKTKRIGLGGSHLFDAARSARRQSEASLYLGKIDESIRFAEETLSLAQRSLEDGRKKVLQIACAERTLAHAQFQHARTRDLQLPHMSETALSEPLREQDSLYAIYEFLLLEMLLDLKLFDEAQSKVQAFLKLQSENLLIRGLAIYFEAYVRLKILALVRSDITPFVHDLDSAISALVVAGHDPHTVRGYLGRTELFGVKHRARAQKDLDEAWEIAERGPMKLFLADIHLYRARLFFREIEYPWESPAADLAAAEKLINDCGYHRRDAELADAKAAISAALAATR